MRFERNPGYRPKKPWRLSSRGLWLWRVLLLAILAALVLAGTWWVGVTAFLILWVIAEILQFRRA